MKIIQLIQTPQLRGAEIFACQLSNHLIEQGHDVIVVSIFKGNSKLPFEGEMIHLDRPLSKRFYDFKGWKEFSGIVASFKPDIIQLNAADTLKFAVASKLLYKWHQPLVYRNANKFGDFIDSRWKWEFNNFQISKMAYVISVSRECEKDFIQTFNYPQHRSETVEIGVEDIPIGEIPADLREVFDRGPVIAHIGGFVPEKNHEGLINIYRNVLRKFPNAQLLLLGKGDLQEKIRQKVKDAKLNDNVHFLGYRNDVLDIVYHADVFVLPSLIEGLPGVILEAMFCETPVIAYNVGGIGEVVTDETGWLIPKGDENKFTRSLEEVLEGTEKTSQKVSSAKKMISERFINDKIAERFAGAYEKCLKQE